MTKKLKIYLDTSVINFLFADDAPQFKEITIDFFENYLDDYDVFISQVVIDEINRTQNIQKRKILTDTVKKFNLKIFETLQKDILKKELFLQTK
jgi:rRNA-processing protein FCF1